MRAGVRFAGYAAVFDAGSIVGAMSCASRRVRRIQRAVPLLWQHGGAPVGTIETIGEDARGLRVIGSIDPMRGWRGWYGVVR